MRRVFLLLLPLTVIGIYWGASHPSWPPFVGEQPNKNLSIAEKNKLNEALVSELEAALNLPTGSSVKLQNCTLEIRILTGNACHSQAAHTQVKTLVNLREVERVSTLTKNPVEGKNILDFYFLPTVELAFKESLQILMDGNERDLQTTSPDSEFQSLKHEKVDRRLKDLGIVSRQVFFGCDNKKRISIRPAITQSFIVSGAESTGLRELAQTVHRSCKE
ncbi:MAG: hypothetical protein ABJP66_06795 [Hyphomicrobiales bacterium]|uniref:hypothetical protein n=1 Tax=Shimia thalassica TaxID=1715693 RepID=UPI003296EBB0